MTQQTHNFRIEFYGGPQDGEVIYQRAAPELSFDLAIKLDDSIEMHHYNLHWTNDIQARYIYNGVTTE